MAILDKYRYCEWGKDIKKNPALRMSDTDYVTARLTLGDAIKTRKIEQLEHEPLHVLMTGLISPVNSYFQMKSTSSKKREPMDATDCLIASMALHLVSRLGNESVLLVTGDKRMSDVVKKAPEVDDKTAEEIGLKSTASEVGIEWSPKIYPRVVNIHSASEDELVAAFGGWPLPQTNLISKTVEELANEEIEQLRESWLAVRAKRPKLTVDNLAYSKELEEIKIDFANRVSVYLPNKDLLRMLLRIRKAGKLKRQE
ncbi:MAG: hypothetical protein CMJ47_08045 [Planctomyces sp.]|nr:hypothetical protein [Planctomyces sp.]